MSYAFINMDGNYMLELDDEILIEANAVAELERDRIIKLLESYFKPEEAKAIYPADYEQYLDLIALIKGEGK